ncbi:PucR family transcriptional regulator ligand-binding domain-containing protein [Sphaerisporangium flaviroseum]|uniref:PucR family transcriptional regulator ligand-binding domain-containing protein n=2 Tax=Sphaerisporangium flaviroseum TaxID=509199 RepID=A0ABP7IMX0_9ACTN
MDRLGLTLLSEPEHLDRRFTGVHITDLPDPGRYLSGGELVLTGLMWRREPEDSRRFVEILAEAKVAALGVGRALLGLVPQDVVEACREHGLPLVDVPTEVSFRTLSEVVEARLAGARAVDLRGTLGHHRRIVAAVADGAGLDELFALTAEELGVNGSVISSTGAVIAGRLDADLAVGLAREYLSATRLPHLVRTGMGPFTLFAVDRAHRAAGWALVCDADLLADADTGYELAACVALERGRVEEGRRVERRLAEQLIALACSGEADPAEVAARLRTCGIDAAEPYAVVTASVARPGATDGPDPAALGGQVIEELLDRRVVAAAGADGAVALVPLRVIRAPENRGAQGRRMRGNEPGEGSPEGGSVQANVQVHPRTQVQRSVRVLLDLLEEGVATLTAALPRTLVSVGVSAVLTGPGGIRGGAEEAGHARRLAEVRGGGVVTSDEIYTHALLLATVPDDVRRSFADRILAPLFAYDLRHQSELVRTLGTFLDCAGSWNTCSERLHVHVNTVRYRIRRVEELTGRDLSSMADRVDLFLALRAC